MFGGNGKRLESQDDRGSWTGATASYEAETQEGGCGCCFGGGARSISQRGLGGDRAFCDGAVAYVLSGVVCTLKGCESCWKHWVAFQYFARLPMFVEVGTASKRRMVSSWLLTFVALLAYGSCYKAATVKKCLMAIRFFSSLRYCLSCYQEAARANRAKASCDTGNV